MRARTLWSIIALAALAGGCERKEKVLDVEAPGVNMEAYKTEDGLEVKIEDENGSD